MSEQLAFEGAGAGEETWTVGELCERVGAAIERALPDEVWVRGEIGSLSRSKAGHTYFELVEKSPGARWPSAKLSVTLLAREREWIINQMVDQPTFALTEGLEVRIRGRMTHYGQMGRTQLMMNGIDPVFTVGAIAAGRERVLRALAADGTLAANAAVPWPPCPLRIGLVTSYESAAYNDAVRTLRDSGFGFSVLCCHAQVQGAAAATAVVRAIGSLDRAGVDAVLVVRGGGSATDLAAFDDEAVARAIAACSVPVVAGIGHEIDTSVADHAAAHAAKTPTAAAAYLVERVADYQHAMESRWEAIATRAQRLCDAHDERLDACQGRVSRAATGAVRVGSTHLDHLARRLEPARLRQVIERQSERLDRVADRLGPAAQRHITTAGRRLDAHGDRLRLLDPERVLARGYTLVRDGDGTIVVDPAALSAGDDIEVRFAGGRVDAVVGRTHIDPTEPETEDDE